MTDTTEEREPQLLTAEADGSVTRKNLPTITWRDLATWSDCPRRYRLGKAIESPVRPIKVGTLFHNVVRKLVQKDTEYQFDIRDDFMSSGAGADLISAMVKDACEYSRGVAFDHITQSKTDLRQYLLDMQDLIHGVVEARILPKGYASVEIDAGTSQPIWEEHGLTKAEMTMAFRDPIDLLLYGHSGEKTIVEIQTGLPGNRLFERDYSTNIGLGIKAWSRDVNKAEIWSFARNHSDQWKSANQRWDYSVHEVNEIHYLKEAAVKLFQRFDPHSDHVNPMSSHCTEKGCRFNNTAHCPITLRGGKS